jgi:hypothetical protein
MLSKAMAKSIMIMVAVMKGFGKMESLMAKDII